MYYTIFLSCDDEINLVCSSLGTEIILRRNVRFISKEGPENNVRNNAFMPVLSVTKDLQLSGYHRAAPG